ncbi:hypothetical protein Scep_003729 [Stephania cephalantha]|uniref:Uncharacterized protein n=1 Tax=Stephania cephalantha TaxID=152367 RepID=A0AAP0KTM3_9MAGN
MFVAVDDSVPRRRTLDTQVHFGVPLEKATPIPHSPSVLVDWVDAFQHSIHSLSFKTNTSEMPPTVNELYLHLHTVNHDGVTFIDTRSERFYATPDQPVDDEAVYYNVAGEYPKRRVYGLGSLGRKKRRYAGPGANTSRLPEMVSRSEFDSFAEQLRQVVAFMQRQFGMTMDGAGLSQPQPPPPPPYEQQQPPQIDPADPQQQQDNVDREMQD